VIVGGGAAGFAAAEMLRRERYQGSIVMVSDDESPPVDRPNLSKDYLAGNAPEDWVPLRPANFYPDHGIELQLGAKVAGIDLKSRRLRWRAVARCRSTTAACHRRRAEPAVVSRLGCAAGSHAPLAGRLPRDHRSRRQRAARRGDRREFHRLEVAAALRARSIQVDVVAPDSRPMQHVLGPQMGDFVRALHEEHGVRFHLEDTVQAIDGTRMMLKSGLALDADLS